MKWKLEEVEPITPATGSEQAVYPRSHQADHIDMIILTRRMRHQEASRRMRMTLGTLSKIMEGRLVFESPDEFARAMDLLEAGR